MTKKKFNPTAGEILLDMLEELGISQNEIARGISVHSNRINAIVRGLRSITADTDLRLCKYFGLSQGYFLRLQMAYEMAEIRNNEPVEIQKIKPINAWARVSPVHTK
ncbi:MAG: HigA family addiction module antitoxin [Leptospirales bacterium]|nr:HigA family addiction module antitoxin [Leptospirales bacterium]